MAIDEKSNFKGQSRRNQSPLEAYYEEFNTLIKEALRDKKFRKNWTLRTTKLADKRGRTFAGISVT